MDRTLRVLHLEDVLRDAEVVRDVLEANGIACDITWVQTREDFVGSLERGQWDLILADYSLPAFDGMSALKIAVQRLPDVPFIFVSGKFGEEVAIEALKLGATDYVLKERLSRIVSAVRGAMRDAQHRAERNQAERELRRSEAFLAEAQRLSHTGSWGWGLSNGEVTWSEEQYRLLGFEPASVEPSVDLFLSVVHEQDRARVRQILEDSTRERHPYEMDYRVVLRDGSVRHLRSVGRPVCDETGNIDEYMGTSTDTTERVQAEQAQRDSEEKWRAAYASNPTMYFIVDTAGTMVSVNDFGAEQLGYAANELIGQPVLNIFHEGDRKRVQRNAESCFQNPGRRMRWEARKIRKDGTMLWVRETANAVLLKKQPVLLVVCEDITERKRAAEALHASEERFRTLMQFSFDVYWESDAQHRFIRQEFAEDLADVPRGPGKTRWEIPYLEPDEQTWRKHRATLDAHLPFRDFELARPTPDGGKKYFSVSGLPVFDEAGAFIGYRGVGRHITERKRAEEALRRSEAYLAEAQRLSHTGSFAYDPVRKASLYWSEEVFRICGLDPRRGIPDPDEAARLVHPDDRERTSGVVLKAFQEKAEVRVEYRLLLHDWTVKHLNVMWHPLLDQDGEVIEYVGTVADVSERKHAEAERAAHLWFLESMDRINRAMQGTSDLEQMMSDVLGAVLEMFAGDRAWLVYPCDPEASSWRPVMERTRPEFPGAFAMGNDLPVDTDVATVFRSARAGTGAVLFGPACEHPVPAQVAERFSIRSTMVMAVHPKVDQPYLFGLHQCSRPREWTAQEKRLFEEIGRRLSDALTSLLMFRSIREGERRLEEAQRIAHVGHWERDLETGRVAASDEWYRIFGLERLERDEDLQKWHERWLAMTHPEDRARVAQAYAAALEGDLRFDVEYRLVRPNGELRIVHSRGDVKREKSERPGRIFGTTQDITDLRQAEEALREAQSALARVNRVTTLGVLAASIAHEVNQPLGAMVASAGSCSRWLAAEPPDFEKAQRALERIGKDGRRASEVIDRIRTLVQRQAPRKDSVHINEAILEVIALTRDQIRAHEISLETSLAQNLPPVGGDRVQVQQVILNLVVNAIEAMSAVGDRRRELAIRSAQDGQALLVEVRDSGPGIDPERADQLFEAFYTTKVEGIGMGLSISRSIVEAHGGRLWVSPNAPHGAAFQFSLPAALTTSIAPIDGDTDDEPRR